MLLDDFKGPYKVSGTWEIKGGGPNFVVIYQILKLPKT